ncbi:MAG: hypothetical protein ACOYZ8_14945 [Chloroflexota bacterium]
MKSKNPAFENSLVCLQHPLTLASIVILLLNDHVLKIHTPSWLTGKLSDFAGLFFFPFIVAAGLSLVLSKFDISSQHIGKIAFGFVAVWFVLLKTVPLINSLTAQFASLFIGSPTRLVLDITDLLALTVLFPAWKLWNQSQRIKSTRFAYVVLSIGALAIIATSPRDWAVTSVTDLEFSEDGILYAGDRETFGKESYPVAISSDGGLTWERDHNDERLPVGDTKSYPIEVCHRLHEFGPTCYRVTSDHQFEYYNTSWMKVFRDDIVVRAYDVIIFEWEGKQYMLVAIGEGGVLRRELPDGNWEIVPVINAKSW